MIAEDTTLVQTPAQTYPDRAAVPRAAPIVVPWPWQRLALGAILVVAAVLNFWQLSQVGYGNTYYAAAVRSMLQNWHAFLFNAFDANGFVSTMSISMYAGKKELESSRLIPRVV